MMTLGPERAYHTWQTLKKQGHPDHSGVIDTLARHQIMSKQKHRRCASLPLPS